MASSERVTHLFLDTEFTDLNKPHLISLGLADERGERRFYAELRDTWQASRCSYFVVENVLPQLEGRRDFRDGVAANLKAWIEAFEAPALIWADAPWYDYGALCDVLFRWEPDWPVNLVRKPMDLSWVPGWEEALAAMHDPLLREHHALDDAERNRRAWQRLRDDYAQEENPHPRRKEHAPWLAGFNAAINLQPELRRDRRWWQGFFVGLRCRV